VSGDRHQLDRVLANILSNAFKFSKPGGNVEISLHCDGDGPRIMVKDDGMGIPDGAKEKVFGLFTQVDGSDTRSQSGTGLGMHICKQILTQHNATIDYESELGVGTVFMIRFPAPEKQDLAG
jgi:signal transduction histidine kinase